MSTYLYGIVGRGHPCRLDQRAGVGAPAAHMRTVEAGNLVAVVSDAPENLRAKRRDLLAHEQILEELCTQGATLPMRFGTIGDNDQVVSDQVAAYAEDYQRLLTALDGRVEVNIKATHHEEALLKQVMLDNPLLREHNDRMRGVDAASYEEKWQFGEKVASAVQEREAIDAATITERLRGMTVQENSAPVGDGCFLNVSFLVERTETEQFQSTVEELQGSMEWLLELRAHGPLPPYSFTNLDPS